MPVKAVVVTKDGIKEVEIEVPPRKECKTSITVRVSKEVMEAIDRLIERIRAEKPDVYVSKSDIIRNAVLRLLEDYRDVINARDYEVIRAWAMKSNVIFV